MRIGLIFGAIAGAVAALLLAPQKAGEPDAARLAEEEAHGVMGKVKRQIEEAREAAREAADEKEAEMRRRFEESKS